jgi:hypothetical protein
MLKDCSAMSRVIELSASFALPADQYADFCHKLRGGEISIPKRSSIYRLRTKVDWQCMLYQRRVFGKASALPLMWCSHFSADSSPQGSFDYFNTVEDRFEFVGSAKDVAEVFARPGGFYGFVKWTRRTLPVTVVGSGCSSIPAKLSKFMHVLLLETGLSPILPHLLCNFRLI